MMDTVPTEKTANWSIILTKTTLCLLALASHCAEIAYTHVVNQKQPKPMRPFGPRTVYT